MGWVIFSLMVIIVNVVGVYLFYKSKKKIGLIFDTEYRKTYDRTGSEVKALLEAFEKIRNHKNFRSLSRKQCDTLINVFKPLRDYRMAAIRTLIITAHNKGKYYVLNDPEQAIAFLLKNEPSGELKLRLRILLHSITAKTNADELMMMLPY
jgi:hypothetical protein